MGSWPVVTPSIIAGQSVNAVNARDLHAYLGVGRDFSNWIKERISTFGFTEHRDYEMTEVMRTPDLATSSTRAYTFKEYFLSLDMAKELCMVERNEKGKQARAYFIDCEKKLVLTYQAPKNPFLDMSEEEWLEYTLLTLAFETREFQTNGKGRFFGRPLMNCWDNLGDMSYDLGPSRPTRQLWC